MADSFLVLVPHKTLHGTISILIQRPKLATDVGKMGAVKNKMPFIPQCPGPAQSAAAEMPGGLDGRFSKPTLFHRQGMRPHAELHQQPYPGNGHWKLKVMHSFQLTGTQKPCKVCAEFCSFGGSCSWGHMQTIPNPAEQTLHVRLKPEGVQAGYARKRKRRDHAKAAVEDIGNISDILAKT